MSSNIQEKPFFSIIIPTYNSGKTIGTAINSVLEQTYQHLEILIQDGCSKDETIASVNNISDPRIRLASIPDKGIYDAMNKAIERAEGQWLFFLGSDDKMYSPDTLARAEKVIKQNPASAFFYGDVFTSENKLQSYAGYSFERLLEINICHQAIFYQASLLKTTPYNLRYPLMADWDLNLKVFKKSNNPVYLDFPVSVYNLEGASTKWYEQDEYIRYFSNKRRMLFQYGGLVNFLAHYKRRFLGARN